MSPVVYFASLSLIFGTIIAVFGMKYFSAAFAARARISSDESWKKLAESSAAAQSGNETALNAIRADVSRLAASLEAVEKILKQVE